MSKLTNNNNKADGTKFTTNQLHKMMGELIISKLNNISKISNIILNKKFPGYDDGSGKRKFLHDLSSDRAWIFGTEFHIERISGDEINIQYHKFIYGKDTFDTTIKLSDLEGSDRDIAKRARRFYYEAKHGTMFSALTNSNAEIRAAKREIRSLEKNIEKLEWEISNYKYELDIINPLYDHYVNGAPLLKDKGREYENYKNSKSI